MMPAAYPSQCWPTGGEIDIMESNRGHYGNQVTSHFHWGTGGIL